MYHIELEFIKEKVIRIYKEMLSVPLEVMDKGSFDTLTNVDLAIEETLIKEIKKAFPHDSIISEEFNPLGKVNGRTWVIDPIDGTVNFSRGGTNFGIQIALFDNNEVVLSYMYFPRYNDEYYAILNQGAYFNNKQIMHQLTPVSHTIMSFSDFFVNDPKANKFIENLLLNVKNDIFRTRFIGCSSVDFASLAVGTTDALVMRTNNLWDLAPGYLLVKEAGCTIINEKTLDYNFDDYALIAVNNKAFIEVLKKALLK
ncbi:MAG: inositol monophosphatase [Bacilli bacterium]|nr:inositol monophosphatase [Bacilli bacterium]